MRTGKNLLLTGLSGQQLLSFSHCFKLDQWAVRFCLHRL